jgi:hypothetical protein
LAISPRERDRVLRPNSDFSRISALPDGINILKFMPFKESIAASRLSAGAANGTRLLRTGSRSSPVVSGSGAQDRKNQQHAATKENDQRDLRSDEKEGVQISVASNKNNFEPTVDAEHRAANQYRCQPSNNAHRDPPQLTGSKCVRNLIFAGTCDTSSLASMNSRAVGGDGV